VFLQWFMTPMRAAAAAAGGGGSAAEFTLCAVQHAPDAAAAREDPTRSLAQRLRLAQASTAPGQEDTPWTLFRAYKRLCDTDQALVDILQVRAVRCGWWWWWRRCWHSGGGGCWCCRRCVR
jgi:hypothetical protein